ncbi:hypothetical protein GPECTOR_177g233 [Gonium pectorale]|uniref:14-3-3 domain-containing protein n=1 Tax=Gonium pectorale TaxID=33097 RepID=A0A150FXC7_GONPE|nr:hypothetical protein GPECTOR_177g233 [Gonium pectorale]|eukprot:KXZ42238.1 hypothetical protein GPECTOR_177g233 [Gonium pectorale]
MKADCYRYLAEYKVEDARQAAVNQALADYTSAQEMANRLPTTNHVRLGLSLNFSVFWYSVMDEPLMACAVARSAYDQALGDLVYLGPLCTGNYKASVLIMRSLRDNLEQWDSEMKGDDEANS